VGAFSADILPVQLCVGHEDTHVLPVPLYPAGAFFSPASIFFAATEATDPTML
jgi:hypothetical protein